MITSCIKLRVNMLISVYIQVCVCLKELCRHIVSTCFYTDPFQLSNQFIDVKMKSSKVGAVVFNSSTFDLF